MGAYIGVDLDGTLATYPKGRGVDTIGPPVPLMLARVKRWLAEGREVRIITARVAKSSTEGTQLSAAGHRARIEAWLDEHLGHQLPIQSYKTFDMICLVDDRAVSVGYNTGELLGCAEEFKPLFEAAGMGQGQP